MRALLLIIAASAADAAAPSAPATVVVASGEKPCMPYCNASCCHFSDPAKDCSGCPAESDWICTPGADCYETGSKDLKVAKESEDGVCEEWCLDTPHCCWFSNPKGDCSGCKSKEYGCRPGVKCYETGRVHSEL